MRRKRRWGCVLVVLMGVSVGADAEGGGEDRVRVGANRGIPGAEGQGEGGGRGGVGELAATDRSPGGGIVMREHRLTDPGLNHATAMTVLVPRAGRWRAG